MPKQLVFDSTTSLATWINNELATGDRLEIHGQRGWFIREGQTMRHNRAASLVRGIAESSTWGLAAALCVGAGKISYTVL